jgi:hypothetical protein
MWCVHAESLVPGGVAGLVDYLGHAHLLVAQVSFGRHEQPARGAGRRGEERTSTNGSASLLRSMRENLCLLLTVVRVLGEEEEGDLFFDFCLTCKDNYHSYNFYTHCCNVSNGVRLIDNSKGIYFVFAK